MAHYTPTEVNRGMDLSILLKYVFLSSLRQNTSAIIRYRKEKPGIILPVILAGDHIVSSSSDLARPHVHGNLANQFMSMIIVWLITVSTYRSVLVYKSKYLI